MSLLALASDWRWETDSDLRITKVSGVRSFMKVGSLLHENVHPEESKKWLLQKERMESYKSFRDFEFRAKDGRGEGVYRWVAFSGEPYFDDGGAFLGYRGIGRDITEKVTEKEGLWSLANLDGLTGLPNRLKFNAELDSAVQGEDARPFALAIIDLDNFKTINDTFGHDAGDQLLASVAQRLKESVRATDLVARLGGDEFALIIRDIEPGSGLHRPIDAILESMGASIELHGQRTECTLSIGVSVFPTHAKTTTELFKNADIALYCAKAGGRNQYSIFHSDQKSAVDRRNRLNREIEVALDQGQLLIHYQPIVDLVGRRLSGVEALLRWNKPGEGVVAAGRFADVFDNHILAARIGRFVAQEAVAQAARWVKEGVDFGRLAINVTAADFMSGDFSSHLLSCMASHSILTDKLCIEVTEGMFLGGSAESVVDGIHVLHEMGFELAFDDYGTGFASLKHLRMPIDRIKIDRSFTRGIESDHVNKAIVRSITDLSRDLGKRITVEGVETASQVNALVEMGCTNMQGYFFSRPVPASMIPDVISQIKLIDLTEKT